MMKQWKQWETLFSWAPKSLQMVTAAMKLKDACSLEKKETNPDSILKSRDITLLTEVCLVKAVFSSSHVRMWELDYKESWAGKNWYFWTVVLEKTLVSPSDGKEIKPVNPKGNQSWIFVGRNDAKAEIPILWPPDAKSQLIGKDPDAGKDCGQEEKGMTEDEIVGWHHRLNQYEFEWTPGDSERQGNLVSCGPWGCKESDTTEQLNNNINPLSKLQLVMS